MEIKMSINHFARRAIAAPIPVLLLFSTPVAASGRFDAFTFSRNRRRGVNR